LLQPTASGFVSEGHNHPMLLDESLFSIGVNGHAEIVTTCVLFSEICVKEATAGCAAVHCVRWVNCVIPHST
jgi:hypothetical protein